ncbi:MAG: BtpA/SgcQ family protein [Planctomycetes bacterium]|nr:BtpA/SgcQ family protein [Planctomycetota bacterium]
MNHPRVTPLPRVIGMLHLHPLPGSPRYGGDLTAVREALLIDADALLAGGVDGLMIENFGDTPFYPGAVPAATIAHITALAAEITKRFDLPLGINVLRNDGCAAVAIAQAVGAAYIRVNILTGARLADQGVIQGIAHDLLRLRANLGAEHIRIMADVDVKHSAPLGPVGLESEVADTLERGGADALIASGAGTGKTTPLDKLTRIKMLAGEAPVYVGSGITIDTIGDYLSVADGVIVGTSLKTDGVVDVQKVKALMHAAG